MLLTKVVFVKVSVGICWSLLYHATVEMDPFVHELLSQ